MKYWNEKQKLFLFFFIVILFSFFSYSLFEFLSIYTEKTSFIWHEISKRKIPNKNVNLLILGDSQVTSGINPKLLREEIQKTKKDFELFYYPRPSEQPEGILNLTRIFKKQFEYKILLINISPVTTSKNLITESHKSLTQNFSKFTIENLKDKDIAKFYFKNFSGGLYYLLIQIFPLLKLNSNFTKEGSLIVENENTGDPQKNFMKRLDYPIFAGFQKNKIQNQFLKNKLSKSEFYWEWGNFENTENICIPQKKAEILPNGVESAFLNLRENALKIWVRIAEENKDKKIIFLYLPFSPFSEQKIGSKLPNSPIQKTLKILAKIPNVEIFSPPENLFVSSDFADYTHLNACGMLKLNRLLTKIF